MPSRISLTHRQAVLLGCALLLALAWMGAWILS